MRPLIYTRQATQASWTEYFYDGEVKVVHGRIETYKPNWRYALLAERGFIEEPEVEAESPVAETQTSGQEPAADKKPKRPKKSKSEVSNDN
jgi:hypothetical protein